MLWSKPADLVREAIKMAGNFPAAWVDQGLSTSPDVEMEYRIARCMSTKSQFCESENDEL